MALQTSGAISLNDIHVEAGGSSGSATSINDADNRGLIGKASGASMTFNEWYGASGTFTMTLTVGHDPIQYEQATGFQLGSTTFNTSNAQYTNAQPRPTQAPSYGSITRSMWIDGTSRIYYLRGQKVFGLKEAPSYEVQLAVEGLHAQNSFTTLSCGFGTYQSSAAVYTRSDIPLTLGGVGINGHVLYGPVIMGTHSTLWRFVTNRANVPTRDAASEYGRTFGTPIIGGIGTTHTITVT